MPLKTLSTREFQALQDSGKIKPEWTYQRYVSWLKKTRKNRAARRAAAAQVPFEGYLTPEQMREAARQEAQSIIGSSVQGINALRPGIVREGDRMAQQELLAGQGLGQALQPIAGQVQDIWGTAANQSATFAQGFSDALRGLLGESAGEANTLASQFGQAGVPDVSQQAGDALYGAGGYVPARSLAASGAGFASAAAMLPGTAQLQGQIGAGQRRQQTQELLAKLDEEIAKAKAKRPEVFGESLERQYGRQGDLFDQWLRERAQIANEQALGLDERKTVADITGVDPVTGQPTADTVADKGKDRERAVRDAAEALESAADTSFRWLNSEKNRKVKVKVGEEPIVIQTMTVAGAKIIQYQAKGGGTTTDRSQAATKPIYATRLPRITPALYRKWLNAIFVQLKREVGGRYGFKDKRLREVAKEIMESAGIKPPKPKPKPVSGQPQGPHGIPAGTSLQPRP